MRRAPDLARALVALLRAHATGTVHVVNRGGCSRLELARTAVRLAGLDTEIAEREPPPDDLARPRYSVLDTSRCEERIGRPMREWDVALREYVEETDR